MSYAQYRSQSQSNSYFIRNPKPNVYEVSRYDGSMGGYSSRPSQVYLVKGNPLTDAWGCDCPGGWQSSNKGYSPCKHGYIVRRWILLTQKSLNKGYPVYYDSNTDKFYPLKGLPLQ